MSISYNDIVKRLIEYRKSLGFSQNQMSKKIGLTQSHYSKIERKEIALTNDVFVKIANAGLDVDYLVTGIRSKRTVINDMLDACDAKKRPNFMRIIISYMNMLIDGEEKYLVCKNELAMMQYHIDKSEEEFLSENEQKDTVWNHIRRIHNLTQPQLAEKLDIDIKRYREVEKGQTMPKIEALASLYDNLGYYPSLVQDIDTNYLLSINRIWESLDKKKQKSLENIIRYSLEYINENLSK